VKYKPMHGARALRDEPLLPASEILDSPAGRINDGSPETLHRSGLPRSSLSLKIISQSVDLSFFPVFVRVC
jgi:hypothetical protein